MSPPLTEPAPIVAAWMPWWDAGRVQGSFAAHKETLAEISPVWYFVQADGSLGLRPGARDPALVQAARDAGVLIVPSISSAGDSARVSALLNDPVRRQAHTTALLAEVLLYGLDGVDIDYEFLPHQDREVFTLFVTGLAAALHAQGKRLTLAAQAKTFDAWEWDGVGALDYAALGAVVDELRLMAYGWCWSSGCVGGPPPGPIAPLHWQEQVIAYTLARVPASRVMLGVHLYGYDWPATPAAPLSVPASRSPRPIAPAAAAGEALIWPEVAQRIAAYQPALQWWEVDGQGRAVAEPWFTYGDGHAVVYANGESVAKRWQLIQSYGLRGVVFWYAGAEDPDIWTKLPGAGKIVTPIPAQIYLPLLSRQAPGA